MIINLLNAELNLTCHLLALLGAHHILHVSKIRVKLIQTFILMQFVTKKDKVYLVVRIYNTDRRDYEIVFLRQEGNIWKFLS